MLLEGSIQSLLLLPGIVRRLNADQGPQQGSPDRVGGPALIRPADIRQDLGPGLQCRIDQHISQVTLTHAGQSL